MALKRLLSTALLIVFLFNIVGYYGVYIALKTNANNELRKKLDTNNFNEAEAITFKVPLAIPYQSNSDFQRVDGEFESNGKFYNLLKQKIENDTLVIVAVPDHEETSLFQSLVDYVQSNTDTPISQKAGKLIENFAKDFVCSYSTITNVSTGWIEEHPFAVLEFSLTITFQKVHTPPPRA